MQTFRNKIGKQVMALVLSVAMIVSSVASSGMTVMASENPKNTGVESAYTETDTTDMMEDDIGTADEEEALEQDGAAGIENREGIQVQAESTESKKSEEQNSAVESTESKKSEEQSSAAESTESKKSEEQSSETESSESKKSEEQSSAEQSSEEQSSVEQSSTGGSDPVQGATGSGKIDVWDFGAKQETNTQNYTNNITFAVLKATNKITNGTFSGGDVSLGDVTINTTTGCRLYSANTELSGGNTATAGYAKITYSDYTSEGGWYAGGNGGENRRYVLISNVKAGDKIVAYMNLTSGGPTQFCFKGQDTANKAQQDFEDISGTGVNKKYEFIAKYDGTYKIYEVKNTGKPMYHRIMRVPAVNVSGTIDLGPLESLDGVTLKFVNEITNDETVATLNGTRFTVKLPAGYTYNAVLSGATGFGPTNDSKKVTLLDTDGLTGKSGVTIVIEEKELYTYSGTIKGFAQDYSKKSNLEVVMKTAEDVPNDDVKLTITELDSENPKFTALLEPDVEYTITLEGVNDYQVKGKATVEDNKAVTADIEVETKPVYAVTGNFVDLDGNAVTGVTALKFKNVDDEYEYDATVAADTKSYTVNLRDGVYSAVATIENYQTTEHVIVDGKAATKDILFVSTLAEGDLTRKADLYVGYSDKGDANYETVSKAVNAATRMKPTKEEERITIHIAPGVYREQIVVKVPYISFVNDTPDKEVKITWYQGIGYQYYSCASGWYNAQDAHDQYKKAEPRNWGAAVQIKATGFLAENIVFEHSLNRYITDEELADGVEPTSGGGKPVRNYSLDVKSKGATERGAALYLDSGGNNAEFYRCKFLSSQDTIGTGKKGAHTYFKECFIEGNTDYICSEGDAIFDNCVLNFKGYSDDTDKKQGGYITAAKTAADKDNPASEDIGYLFWNCTVTGSKDIPVASGYFGRPWDQNAKVAFVNTKLEKADIILSVGWTSMSGAAPEKANFKEYNTTSLDGKTVDTSGRTAGTVVDTNPIADAAAFEKYFGEWTPKHYVREADGEVAISGNVTVTDNADINAPKAGNTLTVHYSLGDHDANDASLIKWYTVEKDENGNEKADSEKLVKASTASAGKTYKIEIADNAVGKYIKVTVTPQTTSGKSGEAKSCTLDNPVREGYEDPSSGGDISLGDGVNIFLAGDSTVKDYSANGMNNKGQALYEGSWGEFFQAFFNESQVKVQNYAQGGRSTRTFINDGRLDSIAENMSEGDYLFIQFGHNDCADGEAYADRYVPVGEPTNGVYPYTAATLGADGKYSNDCGGTFKWFLKQYIDTAKGKGGIPVLVTPVARMYYNTDGTIRPHHNTSTSAKDAYVTAMKQVAEDENVLLIDGYQLTKDLFVAAWQADGNNNDTYGKQIMHSGDSTHCNKLGGMIEAAVLAKAIQNMDLTISGAVKAPTQVLGATPDGKTVFSVNGSGELTAYDILTDYTAKATYWEKIGQAMFGEIGGNAEELNRRVGEITADPAPGTVGKNTTVSLTCATDKATIYYTTDGTIPTDQSTRYTGAISLGATEGVVTIKAIGVKEGSKNSIVYTFDYTISGNAQNPGGEVGDTEETKITVEIADKDKDGKISIKSNDIIIDAADLVYTGKVQYAVTVNYMKNGKKQQLTEGVHYTVAPVEGGPDCKSESTAQKVIVKGTDKDTDLGHFVDAKTVTYAIKSKTDAKADQEHDIAKAKISLKDAKNLSYTGTYITPDPEVKDKDKNDIDESCYSVVYKNNVNAGKASVTVIGKKEKGYYGSKTVTFTIKKADLTKSTVGISAKNATFGDPTASKSRTATEKAQGDFNYKGNAVTFNEPEVRLGDVMLSPRSDYTLTYKKNTQAGEATATIKGANNLSGAITITYTIGLIDIKDALAACNTEATALDAEYSSKGARLASITLSGVTLKEGTDYKVNYKDCKKADTLQIGDFEDVKISGAGSYKNKIDKDTPVKIKVGLGSFHVKDGAIVDKAKLKGDEEKDKKTIISAAKITDASGAKIKPEAVAGAITYTNNTITLTPVDKTKYGEQSITLNCHVATKLSSVKPITKTAKLDDQPFDGVNAVTLTESYIVNTGVLGDKETIKATDIRVVSYKNNNKIGSATVTIEGRPESPFYGTKNLKFKIVAGKAGLLQDPQKEEPGTGESSSVDPSTGGEPSSEPSTGDEPSSQPSTGDEPSSQPSTGDGKDTSVKATIWVVGDSTVSAFNDDYYIPRQGYGEQIGNYFNADVYNLAMSGRSSKNFIKEANYTTLTKGSASVPKMGDGNTEGKYLIIGFGHNDEKSDDSERYTAPTGDYRTEGSFANSLYKNYIKPAIDAGVTPVVATPIVRYDASGSYTGAKVHATNGGDYAQAIRDLCQEEELKGKVILADLTAATKELYMSSNEAAEKFHACTGAEWADDAKTIKKPTGRDDTHINSYGAKMVAWLLGEQTKGTALNKHWRNKAKPSEAADYEAAINKSYVVSEYKAPSESEMKTASKWPAFTDASGRQWYSTSFGDIGGDKANTTNFPATVENGSVTLEAKGNGKISGNVDAFFFYYTRLPAGTIYELSATAEVIRFGKEENGSVTTDTQISYGLMARDDIYLNKYITSIMGDYVVAGTYKEGTVNCFGRKNKALFNGAAPTNGYINAGDTVNLKIASNSDGVTLNFGENEPVSGGFDYALTANDPNYIYVGFYVTRNAKIKFSDISLTIKE